ncbi:MAG: phytoene desaturase family protein [Anaerolineales bacterium]|nr:phytoene desaturase family protein [Anaerolineales bacterium]NUQ85917.1 phytoene desaturase [Anaerolineales bacterium]
MKPKIIVIGAGVGGIVAATHLAQHGIKVTVIEKNSRAGGRCDRISREGHHFDTGPTLLVMPLLYEAEFAALGAQASMREMLDLQRVDPTYHLVFDDGSQLALTSDMQSMCEQLENFERGSFQNYLRYLEEGQRHYRLGVERLVNRDFRKASEFFTLQNIPLLYQLKPLVNHYRNMSAYFDDPRLKAAFTFQDVYMGLSPFEAPATFSMMPYTELAHGVYYPRGGMYGIVEALMGLAQNAGVEFIFNATVKQIDVNAVHARGVVLEDGRHLKADAVLANADLPYVYNELLPDASLANSITRKRFSCSVISFFWGLDKTYDSLGPHTLFLAHDYRENFERIIRDLSLPDNPSLYVHAPARLDPTMSPRGEDTLIAIVPVGHLSQNGEQDWGRIRDEARRHVFRRLATLGVTDIESHIKFETNFTPLSWRKRYNLMKGSTHGLCHNLTQLGYFRPRNKHPRYQNLYFTGASTHPGTGLPTAMVSGRLSARRILDDLMIER